MVQLLSFLLILIINLITTEYVANRKYSRLKTYIIITVYTVFLVFTLRYALPLIFADSVPNILIVLFSWTFLPLFMYLYDNKVRTLIIIMAFSFSHTLLVNGLVYHYFMITIGQNEVYSFLWTQVAIFIVSTPVIIYFIRQTLKKVIASIDHLMFRTAVIVPILNFIMIYVSRFLINFESIYILLIFYTSMVMMIMTSYYFIYRIISTLSSNITLKDLVYVDQLTKLKNRMALYNDFESVCGLNEHCYFYFLDLNNLKLVNDKQGHIIGDKYLIEFSEALKKTFNNNSEIYRNSGDEFVVITNNNQLTIKTLKESIMKNFSSNHPYLGVSIGCAEFPNEGKSLDKLLNIADQRMYKDKENKDK